jgi:hypothetical protein
VEEGEIVTWKDGDEEEKKEGKEGKKKRARFISR